MRWLVCASIVLLAGCSGPDAVQVPASAPCNGFDLPSGCVSLANLEIQQRSCVESAFTIELTTEVYDVPEGYANSPFGVSPQRVVVSLDRCEEVSYGGRVETNVTLGFVAILVEAPDRGQSAGADDYDLELLVDSPGLQEIFRVAGFPTVLATAVINGAPPLRHSVVSGDVAYEADVQFLDVPAGVMHFSDVHHSPDWWYLRDRNCDIYGGTALVQLVATQGELVKAMPAAGPIHARGTQSQTCDITVTFGGNR